MSSKRVRMIGFATIAALAAALSTTGWAMKDHHRTAGIAPARDGNIAIREELDAARRAQTLAAYDLFIARHPQHALIPVAREERHRLERRLRRRR
jgi:hypothetical protein